MKSNSQSKNTRRSPLSVFPSTCFRNFLKSVFWGFTYLTEGERVFLLLDKALKYFTIIDFFIGWSLSITRLCAAARSGRTRPREERRRRQQRHGERDKGVFSENAWCAAGTLPTGLFFKHKYAYKINNNPSNGAARHSDTLAAPT